MQARRVYTWLLPPQEPWAEEVLRQAAAAMVDGLDWYRDLSFGSDESGALTIQVTVFGRDRWAAARRAAIFADTACARVRLLAPRPRVDRLPAHGNRGHRRETVTPAT